MDQKRLFAAIAISIGILLGFNLLTDPGRDAARRQAELRQQAAATGQPAPTPDAPGPLGTPSDASAATGEPTTPAPRVPIAAPRVEGSVNLRGARLDDLVLRDYRETTARDSALVRLFAPREGTAPYYAQWGWTATDGRTRVPDNTTEWRSRDAGPLAPGRPLALSWDNGQGQTFEITLAIDENFLFTAEQRVRNAGPEPVTVTPWARVRRERTPPTQGYFILHEGFVGVLGGRLQELTYADAKEEATKRRAAAFEADAPGGWAGFTDKYWLTALAPVDQAAAGRVAYRHAPEAGQDRWQVDFTPAAAPALAPGGTAAQATRLFAGAKEVRLLDSYEKSLGLTNFDKAIDFGWFYFLTKPFFYALDWLYRLVGNFGVAILIFTVFLKAAFFPLASKSYRSMSKMKILGPKMQEARERLKDEPAKLQQEMLALYKAEKVNPASGCLPILLQIPVFFALYKVLFVTIEMRHAPFFGWIRDLSAPDPTNLFNLFGLLPFDPAQYASFLHMPAWALIMGVTMYVQQKLNPQPPDPVQAKVFQFMPIIFTFMLAGFPAGLVIYWSWNNLLSVAQQWVIMRRAEREAAAPAAARG